MKLEMIKNIKNEYQKGFSLAETLLVLFIVGVVVAESIPIMINSFETKVYKTSYKAAF